jgi:hypothetical protein
MSIDYTFNVGTETIGYYVMGLREGAGSFV